MSELKSKTMSSFKWSALERIISQGIQLALMLILARLLGPKEFGLIGILAVFIAIGQVFIDSGFSSALIRKTDRTEADYSTAFYCNILIALFCYTIMFLSAPFIAKFYQEPEISSLMKIIGLSLFSNSYTIVHRTILTVEMNFKSQAKASISSVIFGGAISLFMAWKGFGIWALIAQVITVSLSNAIILKVITGWSPTIFFSKKSFDYLFNFGGKMLLSGLLDTAYNNLYQIIIGKKFDAASVGQFTQANQVSSVPAMTMTNIIQRVTYPMFSHMQHDPKKMEDNYILTMKIAALVIFPLMAGIALIGQPLLQVILGDEWVEASKLIVALSLAYMLYPIHAINLNVLQVKGRSDLFLKLEVIKKILGVIIILITMNYNIYLMCVGLLLHSYVSLIFNTYYTGKLTGLNIRRQIKEILPIWLITLFSSVSAWCIANFLSVNSAWQILIIICSAVCIYISLLWLTQNQLVKIVKSFFLRES